MNDLERKEISEAISAADDALYQLRAADKRLKSARNWGLVDIFGGGGGLISGIAKHSKMSSAKREIDEARFALQKFSRELRDVFLRWIYSRCTCSVQDRKCQKTV